MPGYSDIMFALANEERAYKADMAEMYGDDCNVNIFKSNVQGYKGVKQSPRDEEEGRWSGNNSTEHIFSKGQSDIRKSPQRRRKAK